jgi:transglutaminase TgpA-like protein/transglutaminase superfamily protein/uncharacterized protein DUF4129
MMNHRLTAAAAVATIAASLALFAVLQGSSWMIEGIGAIVLVALAGTLTRAAAVPAAIGATLAVLIGCVPLLVHYGWGGRVAALVLVAAAGLSATGNRLARGYAVLATYCAFLLIYLNAVFAAGQSYARLIPSQASVTALTKLPSQASPQFRYSPPIFATKPVDLVAVAGIGAVAIIVDFIAVRLRRPALAGLPLLLLFSVPVASDLRGFGFAQTIAFGLAVAGYLMLLSTDGRQRLRMWGRLVTIRRMTSEEGTGPDTRDLAATGRRVGLAAICLAIAVPIVLPSSRPHDIFNKDRDGLGGALGASGSGTGVSPLLNIHQQLTEGKAEPVLSYTSDYPSPGQEPYLQAYVLNYQASNDSWQIAASGKSTQVQGTKLPYQVPGLAASTNYYQVKTKLVIDSQPADKPMPLPYAPIQITDTNARQLTEGSGTLMVEDNGQQGPLRLTVISDDVDPTQADFATSADQGVPAAIQESYGGYRGPDVAQLRAIAERQTTGATSPLQDAVYLQRWFTKTGGFRYSLRPNLPNNGWLLKFLKSDRRGYCQQFAWAFAVLARLIGIPSRIDVGWTAGTLTGNTWRVSTADAHAWPELYFPQLGWVRFEPTPGGPGGQGTATTPDYTTGLNFANPNPNPGSSTGLPATNPGKTSGGTPGGRAACGRVGPAPLRSNSCGNSQAINSGLAKAGGGFPVGIVVPIVVLLLLAAPGLARWLTRRRRWLTADGDAAIALTAWRELHDDLADFGIPTMPSDSPRTTVARVSAAARLRPHEREALARIAFAVERARYSLGTQPGTRLRADATEVRKAMAANSTRTQRLRALLLPPSTMAALASALQSAGRATSWIDSSWPAIRRQLRRTVLHRAG